MMGRIRLFPWELESINEYSFSLPTATTLFKTWKREYRKGWMVGRFVEDNIPGSVGILWMTVQLLHGPPPKNYTPPDWSNFKRWQRETKSNIKKG